MRAESSRKIHLLPIAKAIEGTPGDSVQFSRFEVKPKAVKVFTDSPYNNRVANEEDVLGAGISL